MHGSVQRQHHEPGLELWRRLVAQFDAEPIAHVQQCRGLHADVDGDRQRRFQEQEHGDPRDSATAATADGGFHGEQDLGPGAFGGAVHGPVQRQHHEPGLEFWRRIVAQLDAESIAYVQQCRGLHGDVDGDRQRRFQEQDPGDPRDGATATDDCELLSQPDFGQCAADRAVHRQVHWLDHGLGLELRRRPLAQLVSKSKSYLRPSWRLHGHADGDWQRRGDQPQDPVDSRDSATTAIAAIAGPLIDTVHWERQRILVCLDRRLIRHGMRRNEWGQERRKWIVTYAWRTSSCIAYSIHTQFKHLFEDSIRMKQDYICFYPSMI